MPTMAFLAVALESSMTDSRVPRRGSCRQHQQPQRLGVEGGSLSGSLTAGNLYRLLDPGRSR